MNETTDGFVRDLQTDPVRRFIHDINNHLGTAIGFTAFLTEDLPMPSPARHHALRVQDALLACRNVVRTFAARQSWPGKDGVVEQPCLLLVSTNITVGDAVAAALEGAGLAVASCRSMAEAIEILQESLAWDGVMANIEDRDILTYMPSHQNNPLRLLYGGIDDTVAHVGFSTARPLSEIARLVALLLRRG